MNAIKINPHELCGNNIMAVDSRPVYAYSNGQPTDHVIGRKYAIVLPSYGYERIWVKVLGDAQIDVASDTTVNVELTGFTITAYTNRNGRGELSFKADSISIVD